MHILLKLFFIFEVLSLQSDLCIQFFFQCSKNMQVYTNICATHLIYCANISHSIDDNRSIGEPGTRKREVARAM